MRLCIYQLEALAYHNKHGLSKETKIKVAYNTGTDLQIFKK